METVYWREAHARRRAATEEGRPALVLLHGLGESGLCFEGFFARPELAAHEIVAVDQIGHGRSRWLPEARDWSLSDHADWLAPAVAELVRSDAVILLGHSMGGLVGSHLARRGVTGKRLAGFVNVEGNLSPGDCTASAVAARYSREQWRAHGHSELLESLCRAGIEDVAQRGYHASCAFADPEVFHRESLELVSRSADGTGLALYRDLPLPRLYVAGGTSSAEESRRALARHELETVVIEGAGHWPFLDAPETFFATLERWLRDRGRGDTDRRQEIRR